MSQAMVLLRLAAGSAELAQAIATVAYRTVNEPENRMRLVIAAKSTTAGLASARRSPLTKEPH